MTRMLQSFGQAQDDLPTLAAKNAQEMSVNHEQDAAARVIAITQYMSVLH
ncbi:hypothetical protein [Psychrobacter sp. JCM 18901]|nr:hypothetical protein [Psychrobacter sp. JCM 18901]